MLRITVAQTERELTFKLEGRVAGVWADEVARAWGELRGLAARKECVLDLRNVMYASERGTCLLTKIYCQTQARLLVGGPWTQSLADRIKKSRVEVLHLGGKECH